MVELHDNGYGEILLYILGGVLFIAGGLLTSWIIRPHRPNAQKLATYESGEETIGTAWGQFSIRFYVIALLFLLFEVEILFLFPWAVVFGQKDIIEATSGAWGWFALVEMLLFIGILTLGLAYAWAKGYLDWAKAKPIISEVNSPVPSQLYESINKKYAPKSN
jgi:NADH-quinone oxidoreductase subunit A